MPKEHHSDPEINFDVLVKIEVQEDGQVKLDGPEERNSRHDNNSKGENRPEHNHSREERFKQDKHSPDDEDSQDDEDSKDDEDSQDEGDSQEDSLPEKVHSGRYREERQNHQQNEPQNEEESSKEKRKVQRKPPNSLKCDKCDYRATYQSTLNIHMIMHTDAKTLTCKSCSFTTKYPHSLLKHISAKHKGKNNKYSCADCDFTTKSKWNLTAHKRKHSIQIFNCDLCNFSSPHKYKLASHSKVHSEEMHKCEQCPFETKFEGHIVRHRAKIHNQITEEDLKCEKCNYVTRVNWRLNIHLKKSIQDNDIACDHCDFKSKYECEYKLHKYTHRDEIQSNEKTSICTRNERYPTDDSEFRSRDLDYNETNNFIIDTDCVNWKMIPVHKIEDKEKPFQCSACDHKSKYKAAVQRHYERHHTDEIKPYKCINCDFSTKTKHQIALHNSRSRSELEIVCKTCPYRTHYKCSYVIHQRKHYPYKCSQCDYTCKSTYDIQRHNAAVHLGKILTCEYCGFKSPRKETMSYHLTIHTGQRRYKCELCDYSCMRPSLLTNHKKRFHRPEVLQNKNNSDIELSDDDFGGNSTLAYNLSLNWDGRPPSPINMSTLMSTE